MSKMLPKFVQCISASLLVLSLCKIVLPIEIIDNLLGCYTSPDVCPNSNVTFWLYTRESPDRPYRLDVANPQSIKQAPFVKTRPLVVLIHGFTGHKDFSPNTEIRPAYFHDGEYNIISVDYAPLVRAPCYVQAVQNLPVAARCTAQLLDALVELRQFSLRDIHVIGFSLGAHTAGLLDRHLRSGRLPRITGLDPAKPLFVKVFAKYRLSKNDAEFVDVVHTDGLIRGFWNQLGHVDFYMNGGLDQPGCQNSSEHSSCNHAQAPLYYAESIRYNGTDGFWGFRCPSWSAWLLGSCRPSSSSKQSLMGWRTPNETRGLFIVPVNQKPPYAMGMLS